jgi:anti-anti-sigma factor
MTCQKEETNPAVVVRLATEIDLTNSEPVFDRLQAALAGGVAVVVADFTATWFCDSASLRRMLTVQQLAAARGGQLRLVIPPGGLVSRLADLTGLDHQLHIYPSVREAIAWLPRPGDSLQAG